MGEPSLHVAELTRQALPVFRDRVEAGERLAAFVAQVPDPDALVFALPRGGVPVARPFADVLGCPLLPALVRKLPIPVSPEMGFGAVTIEGNVVLNDRVVDAFGISDSEARRIVGEVGEELRRRANEYPGGHPLPQLEGRTVYLVDDGLATGYTAVAAADMLTAHRPMKLTLAVPCAPATSLRLLAAHVDETFCLYEQVGGSFAVASYYRRFPDLTDDEVRRFLQPPAT